VAHEKRPKLCNDAVLLNNRIQTKKNYDIIRFCFHSEIRKKSIGCPNSTKQPTISTRLTVRDRYPVTAISGKCAESRLHSAF